MGLLNSINQLHLALEEDLRRSSWGWQVRRRLAAVRDELDGARVRSLDGWLSARASSTDRTRLVLLERVVRLLGGDEWEHDRSAARAHGLRLVCDLDHFHQRLHDLVYDSVELEIGGSE